MYPLSYEMNSVCTILHRSSERQDGSGFERQSCCDFIRQTALFGYCDAREFYSQLLRFSLKGKHFRLYLLDLDETCRPPDYHQLTVRAQLNRLLERRFSHAFYLADNQMGQFLLLFSWNQGSDEPEERREAALDDVCALLPFAVAPGPCFGDFSEITNAFAEAGAALRRGELRPASASRGEPARVVLEYLKANYTRRITLEEIAGLVHMNASYVSRLLPRLTGKTFTELLTELRLEKAKELLRTTAAKNSEIAEAVGMENAKYFSQVFKQKTGLTPVEYRRLYTPSEVSVGRQSLLAAERALSL